MQTDLVHAFARFGLGRGPADPAPADLPAWLAAQLAAPDLGPPGISIADGFEAFELDRIERPGPGEKRRVRQLFQDETKALEDHALTTPNPFRERLVWFWANHFTVSQRRGEIVALAGNYVREAIRPHVTGSFRDMLLAVMRHPAMILYLDNETSVGPDSPFGMRRGKGLNENLARECLELHTVSPAAGYTQADVTALARILTGWSVERKQNPGFKFRPFVHEPGDKAVLGKIFPEGEQGGIQALLFLADHPATHRHLAFKLVRHFVSDTPPQDAVRRIEGVLRDTHGDLHAASLELTRLPGAWTPLTKLRSPQDLVLATLRAAPIPPERRPPFNGIVYGLGQGMFAAPFPIGWPDTAAEWAGPEAMLRRIDWIYGFSGRPELPEPAVLAETALGGLITPATSAALSRAGSRRDAITLLLASPESQRR